MIYDAHLPMPPWPWEVSKPRQCSKDHFDAVASTRTKSPEIIARRRRILEVLKANPWVSMAFVKQEVGFNPNNDFRAMLRSGIVQKGQGGLFALSALR